MFKFLEKIFDSNEKQLKKIDPIIEKIESLNDEYSKMSDQKIREEFDRVRRQVRKRIDEINTHASDDENDGVGSSKERNINKEKILAEEKKVLSDALPEVFAMVREASWRVAKHKHYKNQLQAGYFLFENNISELFTGEGKTLAANLPLALYAISGKGAHLVTVNDYLARRDAEWNGHILSFLGLTVGAINNNDQYVYASDERVLELKGKEIEGEIKKRDYITEKEGRMKYDHMTGLNLLPSSKKETYDSDVIYGTSNEFGFDYLRDNMVRDLSEKVQRELYFVIVDEADSILIDEARTPLIISQSAQDSNELYSQFARLASQLDENKDYTVDEKSHAVMMTDEGMDHAEKIIGSKNIYENASFAYHLENALKARELFHRDDQYIVRDGQILIVDQFTGRVMDGRRYSEGLHQAIEAKEGVEVKKESKTIATITLQNYFRLYDFRAGMTATALTEAEEFAQIYDLDVVVIPTNKPVIRKDHEDVVYRTEKGKYDAIMKDIIEHKEKGQPVLVGTTSVEKSEMLSEMLNKEGITHNVLNAKHHEKEAKIVSEAGHKGMITIATNMAGRGTDISLEEGVEELGGLYIIGSERHESRRIDNQLRGRSGRRGEPGESRFYVSFEDDLMRIFGGPTISTIIAKVGMEDDIPISYGILGKTIENAQKRVEAHHYEVRKQLVEYDDVLNQQREIIYGLRRSLLKAIRDISVKNGGISVDYKKLDYENIERFLDSVNSYTFDRKFDYFDESADILNHPISVITLKKSVDYLRNLLSVQMDDMHFDNAEQRNFITQVQSLLTDDLIDRTVKELGYKDQIAYFKAFEKEEDYAKRQNLILKLLITSFIERVKDIKGEVFLFASKMVFLQTVDQFWMEHLDTMADLREGISLRNIANKDPLIEYKNEGFSMFESMLDSIDSSYIKRFYRVKIADRTLIEQQNILRGGEEVKESAASAYNSKENERESGAVNMLRDAQKPRKDNQESKKKTYKRKSKKVGRNEPCPCGSGKKYKKCCYPKYE
ncbi:MAG TPA: preprotein translocase subunit SecA [bacterium]|nr:preprotein translocase subunit SecA [bacterium]